MTQMTGPDTSSTPPAPPRNSLGTAGFVLGLVGLLFSFLPLIGVIAWPLVILGLIFSIIGIRRASAGAATNKGLTITGAVLSAIGLVICIAWVGSFGSSMNKINHELQQPDQGQPPAPGAPPQQDGNTATRTVLYEVTGSDKALNVTYTTDGMASTEQQQNANLPFKKEISIPRQPFQVFSLSAQNAGSGTITCKITVDGKVIKEASSGGPYSVAMCSGNVTN